MFFSLLFQIQIHSQFIKMVAGHTWKRSPIQNFLFLFTTAMTNLPISKFSISHGKGKLRKYILLRKFLAVESSVAKIYLISFPLPLQGTGYGDVTYNPRRNFLGAMPVKGKIAYHLYNFGTSKSDVIIKLIRKSSWHSQYSTKASN
mgnify:CR=1 FL=1